MPDNHQIIARAYDLFDPVSLEDLGKFPDIKTAGVDSSVGYFMDFYWLDLARPKLSFGGEIITRTKDGLGVKSFQTLPEPEQGDCALQGVAMSLDDKLVAALQNEIQRPAPFEWTRARVALFPNVALIMPAPPRDLIDIALSHQAPGVVSALRLMYQTGLSSHARLGALSTAANAATMIYDGQRRGFDPAMRPIALTPDLEVTLGPDLAA